MIRFAIRRSFEQIDHAAPEPERDIQVPDPEAAPLVVLAADAASLNVRRMHCFADAAAASDFIRFWFPAGKPHGLISFWALPEAPEDVTAEVVVLVRDDADPGLVYPFSFVDLATASAFVRDEVARGADPPSISVHFAVPVSIRPNPLDDAELWITPASAPARPRREAPPSQTRWSYQEVDTPAVSEVAPVFSDDLIDRVLEVLRFRRWGIHPKPFMGFGSPPGRF